MIASALSTSAQLTATLNYDTIPEYQTVELKITDEQPKNQGEPDLSVLAYDFDIGSQSTERSFGLVRGQFTSNRSWRIELTPKRSGRIIIPPITVGGLSTNSLTLNVVPLSQSERKAISDAVFFETVLSHEEQYPQAAIYVTRRILYNHQVRIPPQPEDKGLDVDNATVFSLGSMTQFRENHNGVEYNGMEWRYVVFAERSGTISIPSESMRAGIYPNRGRAQIRTIVAEEKNIEILPLPESYPPDAPWFPASSVTISEQYDLEDLTKLEVGQALARNISLGAIDSYHSALPPIDLGGTVGLRVYPEQPDTKGSVEDQAVRGDVSQIVNYIAAESGQATIPPIEITWWDVNERQVKVAALPGRSIAIGIDQNLEPTDTNSSTRSAQVPSSDELSDGNLSLYETPWFYVVVLLAIAGWGTTAWLVWRSNQAPSDPSQSKKKRESMHAISNSIKKRDYTQAKGQVVEYVARELNCNIPKARAIIRRNHELDSMLTRFDSVVYSHEQSEFSVTFQDVRSLIQEVVDQYEAELNRPQLSL